MTNKKSFFYFPTWTLILLSITSLGATVFGIYLIINLESFKAITINGVLYQKGSEQYQSGIQTMKYVFGGEALFFFIISIISGWIGYKRIINKKTESNTYKASSCQAQKYPLDGKR